MDTGRLADVLDRLEQMHAHIHIRLRLALGLDRFNRSMMGSIHLGAASMRISNDDLRRAAREPIAPVLTSREHHSRPE
jgi:hypothetical protein